MDQKITLTIKSDGSVADVRTTEGFVKGDPMINELLGGDQTKQLTLSRVENGEKVYTLIPFCW
jgi:hypothetical protein